jgi:orotidine-5'-phosphate decarboxylase
MTKSPVYVAVDTPEIPRARKLAEIVGPWVGGLKLGLEFFNAHGPAGVREVMRGTELPLFLDLKLHDIPNTVAAAVRSVVPLLPSFLTVHASGGGAMLRAAVDAALEEAAKLGVKAPGILAVTVLTSLDGDDLHEIGQQGPIRDQVARLAQLAKRSGVAGIVCAPGEVTTLREQSGPDFVLMVPGIRPVWAAAQDQKRILTPAQALQAGASHLVIGRPITGATDPAEAARLVAVELRPLGVK